MGLKTLRFKQSNFDYFIKQTEQYGRGLYASKTHYYGDLVAQCEILVLSPADTLKINETDLKYYTFVYNQDQDCLVLGDGEIFNHDDNANVSYSLVDYDGRKVMQFKCIKPVQVGEQFFTNYNEDTQVETKNYFENKSLID